MNMWDERYAGNEYAYGTEPNSFLVERALKEPRGRVLSIAEGEGRNAVWLASQGFDVTSFDQSTIGVTKTLKLALHRSVVVHAFKDDMTTFEIEPNSYDMIVSIFAHTTSDIRRGLHQRVTNGLCRGGVVVLEAYTPNQIPFGTGGPKDPDLMPTTDELRTEFPGLVFEHLEEVEREVVEGTLHTGHAAVVQMVARKPL
jgi:hypothetical protein